VRTKIFRIGFFLFLVAPTFAFANRSQLLAELTASDGVRGDELGESVAVCGNTVVVGASELNSSTVGPLTFSSRELRAG
jgi:FG-GAP repeat